MPNFTKILPLGAEFSASSRFWAILRTRPKMASYLANPLYYN